VILGKLDVISARRDVIEVKLRRSKNLGNLSP
jgi:hypothetical protein